MSSTHLATEFERAEDSPGLLLWQLSSAWQAQQRAALRPFGLTHVQFVLLAALTYTRGTTTLTQTQLAQFAQTDVMMTSQVLRRLEKHGLVRRQPSQRDKRAFTISPTSAGMDLANRAITAVEAVDRQFFATLGMEVTVFADLMRRLIQ